MKKLVVLLMVSLMAASAFAGIDDGDNSIGIFFDLGGNNAETTAAQNVPFFAYLVVSNPTFPELSGVEVSYRVETPVGFEAFYFRLAEDLYGGLNVAQGNTATLGQYIIGWGTPRPTSTVTPLVGWQCMLLTVMEVKMYIGPSTPESIQDGLPALEIGGTIIPADFSTGAPSLPVAIVNRGAQTDPVVPDETTSFGDVKALFR